MWKVIGDRLSGIRLRLLFLYVGILFAILISVYIGTVYGSYHNYLEEEGQKIQYTVESVLDRLDHDIEQMDYILLDAISDESLISALKELRSEKNMTEKRKYELTNIVSDCIVTESSIRTLHRLSVFTSDSFFVTTNVDKKAYPAKMSENIWWLSKARMKKGEKVLLGPGADPWGRQRAQVITLARLVRDPGKEIGFIEAQLDFEKVREICSVAESFRITVLDENGQIFYTNSGADGTGNQDAMVLDQEERNGIWENPATGKQELVRTAVSSETGLKCLVFQENSFWDSSLGIVWNTGVFAVMSVALLSIILAAVFIHRILKPLLELKQVLERTDLDTLQENGNISISGSKIKEINSLISSFGRMNVRLTDSIRRERSAYQAQMNARFDVLQTQINPHFMHNMLNVIVNMTYEGELQEIPEICNRLSENIRYSTSTREQTVTLQEELGFIENYLILMKKRFEYKLEYELRLGNLEASQILLPKLSLIPFVENAVYHPYYESQSEIIRLIIETGGDSREWYLVIRDNGNGFSEEEIRSLREKMEAYLGQLKNSPSFPGLEIGGMGVINTYARLELFSGGAIRLELRNAPDGGAVVLIKGGDGDVPDSDRRG